MNTVEFKVCSTCVDIVVHGYSDDDSLTSEQHQDRCSHIDKNVLPHGYYWLGTADHKPEDYIYDKCECCGIGWPDYDVMAMSNSTEGG